MKFRKLFVAALVLVFAAGVCVAAAAPVKKPAGKEGPKAVVENKAALVGEVIEGEDLAHTFVIRNAGTARLDITNVRPG